MLGIEPDGYQINYGANGRCMSRDEEQRAAAAVVRGGGGRVRAG